MTEPMDMSKDPDRFDAGKAETSDVSGRTLPELLGEGAYEDERNGATWLWGLIGVLAFLAIVSLVISLL